MTAVDRLLADLRRPAGGWTVGLLTLFGSVSVFVLDGLRLLPGPRWAATITGIALLVVHLLWGAHGYYPRRL